MKLDDFKKYKALIESSDANLEDENAFRVYEWMKSTGKIETLDEGFFSNLWKWVKEKFSPTAMKLHKLANEYGRELEKELTAGKSSKADLSSIIETKMEMIAKEDPEYRDLVDALINEKDYEVRVKIQKSKGKVDPKTEANHDAAKKHLAKTVKSLPHKGKDDEKDTTSDKPSGKNNTIVKDVVKSEVVTDQTPAKDNAIKDVIVNTANDLEDAGKKANAKAVIAKIIADAQKWFDKKQSLFADYVPEEQFDEAVKKFLETYGAIVPTLDHFEYIKAQGLFKEFCKKEGYKK